MIVSPRTNTISVLSVTVMLLSAPPIVEDPSIVRTFVGVRLYECEPAGAGFGLYGVQD